MGKIVRETTHYCNLWSEPPIYDRTVVYYKGLFSKIPLFTYIKVPTFVKKIHKGYPPVYHTKDDDSLGSLNWSRKNPIYEERYNFSFIRDFQVINSSLLNTLKSRK